MRTIRIVILCVISFLAFRANASSSDFVTVGLYGEPLSGDDCIRRCVGCPFHDHRYFYKYSLYSPTAESDFKGTFPVFYGGPVISKMGAQREGHKHKGIDIGGKPGAPIVAAWTGKVYYAGWNTLGGWVVIMQHPNGYVTYYAHLKDRPSVRTGQRVIAGQRLGSLGQTGNAQATVPHLHFEVSKAYGGRMVNPLHVL